MKNSAPTTLTIAALPRISSGKAPRLGKAAVTSIESTTRTTCVVTRIEDGKVYVKPIAQSLSNVAEIEVTCLPLYFRYSVNVGCKGIHQPLPTDKSVHAWQPSRMDVNLVRQNEDGTTYVPKA